MRRIALLSAMLLAATQAVAQPADPRFSHYRTLVDDGDFPWAIEAGREINPSSRCIALSSAQPKFLRANEVAALAELRRLGNEAAGQLEGDRQEQCRKRMADYAAVNPNPIAFATPSGPLVEMMDRGDIAGLRAHLDQLVQSQPGYNRAQHLLQILFTAAREGKLARLEALYRDLPTSIARANVVAMAIERQAVPAWMQVELLTETGRVARGQAERPLRKRLHEAGDVEGLRRLLADNPIGDPRWRADLITEIAIVLIEAGRLDEALPVAIDSVRMTRDWIMPHHGDPAPSAQWPFAEAAMRAGRDDLLDRLVAAETEPYMRDRIQLRRGWYLLRTRRMDDAERFAETLRPEDRTQMQAWTSQVRAIPAERAPP